MLNKTGPDRTENTIQTPFPAQFLKATRISIKKVVLTSTIVLQNNIDKDGIFLKKVGQFLQDRSQRTAMAHKGINIFFLSGYYFIKFSFKNNLLIVYLGLFAYRTFLY